MSKHIHRFVRVKIGKVPNQRYEMKCDVTGCVHHVRIELAEGRLSQCYRCGEPFRLTKANMQLAKPHCNNCTFSKDKDKLMDIMEAFEKVN